MTDRPRRPAFAFPWLTAAGVLLAVALGFLPAAASAFQYDRTVAGAGQAYRWLTCHWTHWDRQHLLWSGGAFALLGTLCERAGRARFVATALLAAAVIPACLWVLQPAMLAYRGLSGIDSALFALLGVTVLRADLASGRRGRAAALTLVLIAFAAKVAFEWATRTAVFVDTAAGGFAPAPLAHLAGAAAGAVVALVSPARGSPPPNG